MADIPKVTRLEIARLTRNDDRMTRFLESLFRAVNEQNPDDIAAIRDELFSLSLDSGAALANAQSARDDLARIADALELMAIPSVPQAQPDDLTPPHVPYKPKYYGVFSDTTTQTAAAINTAYAMTFDTTDMSYGVSIGSPTSRVVVDNSGVYNFQFSAQLDKTSGGVGLVYIWCRINGVDVPNSTGQLRIKDNNSEAIASWNYVLSMNAGDYFELMWEVDDTSLQILADVATAVHPAIPSVILTVTDNIM